VVSIGEKTHRQSTPHGFACIHILSKDFLKLVPNSKPSCIVNLYKELIKQGKHINAFLSDSLWFDLGTIERISVAEKKISTLLKNKEKKWHHPLFHKNSISLP
jgi:NDP-sugar pyrophosphorylase family protein